MKVTIRHMKKLLAAALLFTITATPAFAAKKPKPSHGKYDYRQHKPNYKYKNPKSHHHLHAHNAPKNHSN
jgi:hypothetical protein